MPLKEKRKFWPRWKGKHSLALSLVYSCRCTLEYVLCLNFFVRCSMIIYNESCPLLGIIICIKMHRMKISLKNTTPDFGLQTSLKDRRCWILSLAVLQYSQICSWSNVIYSWPRRLALLNYISMDVMHHNSTK